MKYIKPPDFQSVKEFQEFYKKIETDITRLLVADGSARTANELQEKLKQALEAATIYLARKNENYVRDELPKAFDEGKNLAKGTTKLSAKAVNEILEKQGFKYAKNAFKRDTYIELQTAVKSAGNGLKTRVNDIIKDLHKNGKDTIYNVQQAILKDLQRNGILTVEYSNGAKQTLTSYAAMAARSARIESANIGAIGRALQNGTDYVKMTFVPQCCKVCGAYQDKVYCISGKDKRFPALFKTVLRRGYALPHPNCRHEFIPYYLDMESDEDIKKAIAKSKIKYDSKGDLIDVRYQKDIKAYAEWQAGNRQLNAENKEFAQMQAYYKAKGEQPPYTSLGAFRRARRAQAQSYKRNVSILADASKYGEKYPKPKGNNQEVISSNSYEKKMGQVVSKALARKAVVAAREVLRENNRKNEETVIAITLSGERILKQHKNDLLIEVDEREINKHIDDSVVLIHNHPQNDTFSIHDIRFMSNKKIHTIIACAHDGKIFSLRVNCGKELDRYAEGVYNMYIGAGLTEQDALTKLSNLYGWEYKEL